MTPPDKNNEPLDAILRRAMRAQPGPATPECADADSLAAYSDRSLAASERERLEAHFADCMRCQVMLSDIARADESAREATAASEVPWYRRWRVAIPALTAIAAVLVFVAIRRPANEEPKNELVAMAKNEAPRMEVAERAQALARAPRAQVAAPAGHVATLASRPAAPVSKELAMNEARPEVAAKREVLRMHRPAPAPAPASPAAAPAPPPVEGGRVVAIAPAAPVVEPTSAAVGQPTASVSSELAMNQPQPETAQRAESMGYAARDLSSKAAAPGNGGLVAAPEGAAPATVGAAFGHSGAAFGGTAVGAGSGAIAGAAAGSGAPGYQILGAAPAGRQFAGELPIAGAISAPVHSVAWVVGKNGTVQRREANGAMHWQHSGVTTDLVAGSAPSATVCWIVGRSGTIIRTTDGEHWELIKSPIADNLVRATAESANVATITTAGGKAFATSDGGASWHQQ
ncbi:MAG TPA: hypothetical protein VIW95_09965 [Candidatus Binatus sp.]|uniref:hypothetical protein n=1 Tax=Candidatus Binatus sp. TaxID=2811406 RepID=UPI002F4104E6